MKTNAHNQWSQEYADFLNSDNQTPVPSALDQQVFSSIWNLMNPSPWIIFTKIFSIHLVLGTLSLAICHQFGMNPFATTKSLADWIMDLWGHNVCMFSCGVIFVSLSYLAGGYFLTIEEVKTLRQTEVWQTVALSLVSILGLMLFGAETSIFEVALWVFGAVTGGIFASELSWILRRHT